MDVARSMPDTGGPGAQWEQVLGRYKAETDKEHGEVVKAGGLHIFGTERHEARGR